MSNSTSTTPTPTDDSKQVKNNVATLFSPHAATTRAFNMAASPLSRAISEPVHQDPHQSILSVHREANRGLATIARASPITHGPGPRPASSDIALAGAYGYPAFGSKGQIGLGNGMTSPQGTKTIGSIATASPASLRALPVFYERHTSFVCSLDCQSALNQIRCVLAANEHVMSKRVDGENQFRGIVYSSNGAIHFRVFLWRPVSAKDNNRVLVEFQRRTGDAFGFAALYRQCRKSLASFIVADDATSSPFDSMYESFDSKMQQQQSGEEFDGDDLDDGLSMPSLSASLPDSTDCVELDVESLNALLGMAASRFIDVKREGLRALAHAVSLVENRKMLLSNSDSVNPILSKSLVCSDAESNRCAATIVAALAALREAHLVPARTAIFEAVFHQMTAMLDAPCASVDELIEAKRQVVDAMRQFADDHSREMAQDQTFSTVMKKQLQSGDPRLRSAASAALTAIGCH
jgi:hypothetical protein